MTLLLSLAGTALVAAVLLAGSAVRALERRGHRCRVVTRAGSCQTCADVLAGRALGGHVRCACGATSPHLTGSALLSWQAGHHGETLAPLPGRPDEAPAAHAGQSGQSGQSVVDPRDASHAGEEAELAHFVQMLEASGEAERRAIRRARDKPDPITPQLLREAGLTEEAERLEAEQRRER